MRINNMLVCFLGHYQTCYKIISISVIRESEGDLAPKSTSSVFQQVDSSPVQSPDAKRPKGKRKVEDVGVLRRAICFESNEGTAATECKVDFVEIVDSNDESISSDDSETTSGDESEIEDGQEDSEQVCPNVFRLKAELSCIDGI
ncbi:uncharacterized protein [Montipora foliosa]|uniref:uncharacterized protein isoform X2 n=1 Tax=Montipora foliosa TaxID=591990 RepID=UPI0035F1CEDB